MISLTEAREWLRIDGTDNDDIIESLINGAYEYIEVTTGYITASNIGETLADTVAKFLITLWYNPEQTDAERLQRTIDNLLKSLSAIVNSN